MPSHPLHEGQDFRTRTKATSLSWAASTSPLAASVRRLSARHALTAGVRSILDKDATASFNAPRNSTIWPAGNVRSFISAMAFTPTTSFSAPDGHERRPIYGTRLIPGSKRSGRPDANAPGSSGFRNATYQPSAREPPSLFAIMPTHIDKVAGRSFATCNAPFFANSSASNFRRTCRQFPSSVSVRHFL